MKTRTTRSLPRRYVAAGLLLLAAGFASAGALIKRESRGPIEYTPPAAFGCLRADTIRLPATQFPARLRRRFQRPVFRGRHGAKPRACSTSCSGLETSRRTLSKRGEGPGELRVPFSVALWSDTIVAVSDLDELELFDRDGDHIMTARPNLPCGPGQIHLASSERVLFGSANCIRGDTMAATLFRYIDTRSASRIVDEPRNSVSGRWGSMVAALRSIGDDARGVTFGTGRQPCVTRLGTNSAQPARECWPLPAYRSDAPPGFTKGGGRYAWPDTLPYYIDRIGSTSGRVFLLRPFSADSGVIVVADEGGGRPLMVVSLSAMIGCRALGCAWTAEQANTTFIQLVPLARLDSLAVRGERERSLLRPCGSAPHSENRRISHPALRGDHWGRRRGCRRRIRRTSPKILLRAAF